MKADFLVEAAIKSVLMEFAAAYQAQDIQALMALYTPQPDTVVIGSTEDEKCSGPDAIREAYERDFSSSGPVQLEFTWIDISSNGTVAWVAAECLAHAQVDKEKVSLPSRFTAVLEFVGESRWLISQQHFSFPAAIA